MSEHTPTPWRLRTTGNMGNLIEAYSGKHQGDFDNGFRTVVSYQECCASDKYLEQEANCAANGAFIVKAVNNHEALVDTLKFLLDVIEISCVQQGTDITNPTPESAIGRARDVIALVSGSGKP